PSETALPPLVRYRSITAPPSTWAKNFVLARVGVEAGGHVSCFSDLHPLSWSACSCGNRRRHLPRGTRLRGGRPRRLSRDDAQLSELRAELWRFTHLAHVDVVPRHRPRFSCPDREALLPRVGVHRREARSGPLARHGLDRKSTRL